MYVYDLSERRHFPFVRVTEVDDKDVELPLQPQKENYSIRRCVLLYVLWYIKSTNIRPDLSKKIVPCLHVLSFTVKTMQKSFKKIHVSTAIKVSLVAVHILLNVLPTKFHETNMH